MSSIYEACANKLTSFVFPSPVNQKLPRLNTSDFAVETFKKHYILEKSKSLVTGCAVHISGMFVLGFTFFHGMSSMHTLTAAISFVAFTYVWNKWAQNPYRLAQAAYEAITNHNEMDALKLLENGANIHREFDTEPTVIPFYSTGVIKFRGSRDLFTHAAKNECPKVLIGLANLGWNVNQNASALGGTKTLKTARLLVDLQANINLHNGIQFSPLSIQIRDLCQENPTELSAYRDKCEIIEFLLDNGSTLQGGQRFQEKLRVRDWLNETVRSLDTIGDNDLANDLKGRIRNIGNRLGIEVG